MIICKECGNSAESADGFCSSCGQLLEWSGQPVAATAGPGAGGPGAGGPGAGGKHGARQPEAERARPEPQPLVAGPDHAGPYCSACGVRNPEGRTFCRSCGEVLRGAMVPAGQRPGWWRRLIARLRGRPTGAAGAGADPAGPGAAGNGVAGTTAAGRAGAGDGLGGRVHGLSAAHHPSGGAQQPPWARTGYQGAGQGRAGQAVSRMKPPRRLSLSMLAPVLLVLSLAGVSLSPARQWAVAEVHNLLGRARSHYVNHSPVSADASAAAPGHPAQDAIDGSTATYWLTAGASGVGSVITIRFPVPVQITRIGISSGEPGAAYLTQARPETVEIADGSGPPDTVTFQDTSGFQTEPVSLSGVTVLTLTIRSEYAGQQGQGVAIRELQFSQLVKGSA
jgi:hypothetical protein